MTTDTRPTAYVAPALTVVGSLEKVTMGTSSGNYLDKAFPAGTPKNQLTFS